MVFLGSARCGILPPIAIPPAKWARIQRAERLEWYRAYNSTSSNPKWLSIARKASASPAEVVAVWMSLLECASQHTDWGSVAGYDHEGFAEFLRIEAERIVLIVSALKAASMIVADRIADWDRRQYWDSSKARTQRWRSRQKPPLAVIDGGRPNGQAR